MGKDGLFEATLDLEPGDYILYQDEKIREESGITFVGPGMVGKVLSIHPGEEMRQAVEEMAGIPMARRALVEFENGMQILLSRGMKWEKVRER